MCIIKRVNFNRSRYIRTYVGEQLSSGKHCEPVSVSGRSGEAGRAGPAGVSVPATRPSVQFSDETTVPQCVAPSYAARLCVSTVSFCVYSIHSVLSSEVCFCFLCVCVGGVLFLTLSCWLITPVSN